MVAHMKPKKLKSYLLRPKSWIHKTRLPDAWIRSEWISVSWRLGELEPYRMRLYGVCFSWREGYII